MRIQRVVHVAKRLALIDGGKQAVASPAEVDARGDARTPLMVRHGRIQWAARVAKRVALVDGGKPAVASPAEVDARVGARTPLMSAVRARHARVAKIQPLAPRASSISVPR